MISRIENNLNCCGYSSESEASKCQEPFQDMFDSNIPTVVDMVVFTTTENGSNSTLIGCRPALRSFLDSKSTTLASIILLMLALQVITSSRTYFEVLKALKASLYSIYVSLIVDHPSSVTC